MDDPVSGGDDGRSPRGLYVDGPVAPKEVPAIQEAVLQLLLAHARHREQEGSSAVTDVRTQGEDNESAGDEEEEETDEKRSETLFGLLMSGAVPHTPPPRKYSLWINFSAVWTRTPE
jgi:hypothetical protein